MGLYIIYLLWCLIWRLFCTRRLSVRLVLLRRCSNLLGIWREPREIRYTQDYTIPASRTTTTDRSKPTSLFPIQTLTKPTRRMAITNGTCVSFCNQPKAHFGLPWVRPWDNNRKCYMYGKRIKCWSNALQHVPIYLQPFTSYSEILVGNCNFFLRPCI